MGLVDSGVSEHNIHGRSEVNRYQVNIRWLIYNSFFFDIGTLNHFLVNVFRVQGIVKVEAKSGSHVCRLLLVNSYYDGGYSN